MSETGGSRAGGGAESETAAGTATGTATATGTEAGAGWWTVADHRNAAMVAATKLAVGVLVWMLGFRAVSDDDFARVVIAQQWALEPALDPTGTSWLPMPFWLNGLAMLVAGRSLDVARVVALLLGVAAAVAIYVAARLLVRDRRAALAGALLAAVIPHSAILGVATVPELPAAALSVLAIATATRPSLRARLWGAVALAIACLSRYEPWLIALGFAGLTLLDARQGRLGGGGVASSPDGSRDGGVASSPDGSRGAGADDRSDRSQGVRADGSQAVVSLPKIALVLGVTLFGPVAWILHNAVAHGDALHFVSRVSSYKQALEGGASAAGELGRALITYPIGLVRQEPELATAFVAFVVLAWTWSKKGGPRSTSSAGAPWRRVLVLCSVLLVGLCAAAVRGGAPTHHADRPLMTIWLLAAVFVGSQAITVLRELPRRRAAVATIVVCAALALVALLIRPRATSAEDFAPRSAETAIGREAGSVASRDQRVLLEVVDYGYYALLAASGRPEAFILDRSVDPRQQQRASAFRSSAALQSRLEERSPSFVLAHRTKVTRTLGEPAAAAGPWALWRVAPAR